MSWWAWFLVGMVAEFYLWCLIGAGIIVFFIAWADSKDKEKK